MRTIFCCFIFLIASFGNIAYASCPVIPADKAGDPPKKRYIDGNSPTMIIYAIRYARDNKDYILQSIYDASDALYGSHVKIEIKIVPTSGSGRCKIYPRYKNGTVEIPHMFLELLLMKSEDFALAEGIFLNSLESGLFADLEIMTDAAKCGFALTNFNHFTDQPNLRTNCGTAFDLFFKVYGTIRTNKDNWKAVIDDFYYAYYFIIAHEYAHAFLKHSTPPTKEEEIEADLVAFDMLTGGEIVGFEIPIMKLAFSTFSNVFTFKNLEDEISEDMNFLRELMRDEYTNERYLSSECRIQEVLERRNKHMEFSGILDDATVELIQALPIMEEFVEVFDFQDMLIDC